MNSRIGLFLETHERIDADLNQALDILCAADLVRSHVDLDHRFRSRDLPSSVGFVPILHED